MKLIYLANLVLVLAAATALSQSPEKFTEFSNPNCEFYLAQMDGIIVRAQNDPNSQVYILVYEGKEDRYDAAKKRSVLIDPPRGSAKAKIRSMKAYLRSRSSGLDRFKFVVAGYREKMTVEAWFVPVGAAAPEPTPALKEMKFSRYKAKGFCLGCCG